MPAPAALSPLPATVTDACGPPGDSSWVCRRVYELTDHEFPARAADFVVARLTRVVIVVVLAWLLARIVRRAIARLVVRLQEREAERADRRAQRAATVGALLRSVGSAVIWTMAVLVILGTFDIELAPLIAGAGIVGAALAFGAQSLVRDFLSGIFMLLEGQFAVGDTIEAGGHTGQVENVSLRTTTVRDDDGVLWHIPNGVITSVGNRSQRWSRATVDVPLPPGVPPAQAAEILARALGQLDADPALGALLLAPPEVLGPERLGADGYTLRISARTRPLREDAVVRALRRRTWEALQAEGLVSAGATGPTPPAAPAS
jgi:small conductance mechanosensitive channel